MCEGNYLNATFATYSMWFVCGNIFRELGRIAVFEWIVFSEDDSGKFLVKEKTLVDELSAKQSSSNLFG